MEEKETPFIRGTYGRKKSNKSTFFKTLSGSFAATEDLIYSSRLQILINNQWTKYWFALENSGEIKYFNRFKFGKTIDTLDINYLISIKRVENPNKEITVFQIATKGKTWMLASENEKHYIQWGNAIKQYLFRVNPEFDYSDSDSDGEEELNLETNLNSKLEARIKFARDPGEITGYIPEACFDELCFQNFQLQHRLFDSEIKLKRLKQTLSTSSAIVKEKAMYEYKLKDKIEKLNEELLKKEDKIIQIQADYEIVRQQYIEAQREHFKGRFSRDSWDWSKKLPTNFQSERKMNTFLGRTEEKPCSQCKLDHFTSEKDKLKIAELEQLLKEQILFSKNRELTTQQLLRSKTQQIEILHQISILHTNLYASLSTLKAYLKFQKQLEEKKKQKIPENRKIIAAPSPKQPKKGDDDNRRLQLSSKLLEFNKKLKEKDEIIEKLQLKR